MSVKQRWSNYISVTRQIYLRKEIVSKELHVHLIINHAFYGTVITHTAAIKGLRGNFKSSCCEHRLHKLQICLTDTLIPIIDFN